MLAECGGDARPPAAPGGRDAAGATTTTCASRTGCSRATRPGPGPSSRTRSTAGHEPEEVYLESSAAGADARSATAGPPERSRWPRSTGRRSSPSGSSAGSGPASPAGAASAAPSCSVRHPATATASPPPSPPTCSGRAASRSSTSARTPPPPRSSTPPRAVDRLVGVGISATSSGNEARVGEAVDALKRGRSGAPSCSAGSGLTSPEAGQGPRGRRGHHHARGAPRRLRGPRPLAGRAHHR